MSRDLFSDLRDALGCMYISDIRNPEIRKIAIATAAQFKHEDYSSRQWQDLACYLDCPHLNSKPYTWLNKVSHANKY